jgi:hypothetical protein
MGLAALAPPEEPSSNRLWTTRQTEQHKSWTALRGLRRPNFEYLWLDFCKALKMKNTLRNSIEANRRTANH